MRNSSTTVLSEQSEESSSARPLMCHANQSKILAGLGMTLVFMGTTGTLLF